MMRLEYEDGLVEAVRTGGPLRKVATSLGRLVAELAGRFSAQAERDLVVTLA
jgi:hypothetical protein